MNKLKVLITGCNGQLGTELLKSAPVNYQITAVDIDRLDITDAEAVDTMVCDGGFDLIINAAAYVAVDHAETDEELCFAVNR